MRANLHIHPAAFAYNGVDKEPQVVSKLRSLVNDMREIVYRGGDDDQFVAPYSILDCKIYKEKALSEVITEYLDADEQNIFYSMIGNMSLTEDIGSIDDLKLRSAYNADEEEIHTIVRLNDVSKDNVHKPYIQFDEYEIVYNKQSWIQLRRQILGNHPGRPKEFVEACKLYFDKIEFHDNCVCTLCDKHYAYLNIIPRKLVYYLSCLNDCFYEHLELYQGRGRQENNVLADFSGQYGLDEPGSLQGNFLKKHRLKFMFKKSKNDYVEILCEPHLKIATPDSNYKGIRVGRDFNPRIYFHYGRVEFPKKILVGAMGEHIA